MRKFVWLAAAALLLACGAAAQPGKNALPSSKAVDPIAAADDHYRNLEYEQAEAILKQVLQQHPDDLHALNLLGSVTLYREMFYRGLLDAQLYGKNGEAFEPSKTPVSLEFEKRLFDVLDRAQRAADERVARNPNDHEARYWSGVTHGTRGAYYFTLKRSWKAALDQGKAAQQQHKELLQRDPNFVDANMIVGVQEYLIGALPWPIKALAALVGAHGDREKGLQQVQLVADKGNYARDDARSLLAVLYQREERWSDARRELEQLLPRFSRGFLSAQELASVCTRMNDFRCAASTYDMLLARYHAGPPNAAWKRFWAARVAYLSGQAHEKLGETQQALERYQEAGASKLNDPYVRRAQLADADLLQRMGRAADAQSQYQQLAANFPDSDEGKAAKKALKR